MNLALVLPRLTTLGGTEKYAADLARFLVDRGHEVHTYAAARDELWPVPEVHHHPLRVRGRGVGALDRAAREAVDPSRHDLVQGFGRTTVHHVFRAGGGAHAAWLRERHGWRWRLHPRHRAELDIDRRAVLGARMVIANSHMAAGDLQRCYGLPAARIRVIRNGVDGVRFAPRGEVREVARTAWRVPVGGRVALFLGTGFRRKGLRVAVRAFSRAAGPRDRLVVAGRDAHPGRFLRPARALLGERLVVLGPVSEPEGVLPGADALVLPTRYDPAANVTLEALSCGVPPVTSRRDGNAEVLPDPLVVTDPGDVDGFARALGYAWEAGTGRAWRELAEAWPVSRNGEAVETLYRELWDG